MEKLALICEDSQTTAYTIAKALKKFEFNSEISKSKAETLELLNKNKYDLLTLDVLLPDGNGLDIIRQMQNIPLAKDIPIIVISATKKEENSIDFENNIVHWLEKSFDMEIFEKAIEKIMMEQNKNKAEVLHVENDMDLLNLIEMTINDIANVTHATTLAQAKEYLEKKEFDIIILDYVFSEGTSDKLIPTIKSGINKKSKIIMFSAYDENKVIARYVDEIIIKTNVSFDDFKIVIEKFIDTKEQQG